MVSIYSTFSRQGITIISPVLLLWLIENVGFHPTFSCQGITRTIPALLLWLRIRLQIYLFFSDNLVFFCFILFR